MRGIELKITATCRWGRCITCSTRTLVLIFLRPILTAEHLAKLAIESVVPAGDLNGIRYLANNVKCATDIFARYRAALGAGKANVRNEVSKAL